MAQPLELGHVGCEGHEDILGHNNRSPPAKGLRLRPTNDGSWHLRARVHATDGQLMGFSVLEKVKPPVASLMDQSTSVGHWPSHGHPCLKGFQTGTPCEMGVLTSPGLDSSSCHPPAVAPCLISAPACGRCECRARILTKLGANLSGLCIGT